MSRYSVYFLRCRDFVKIGVAKSVEDRLATLRTGNPFPIQLLATLRYPSRRNAYAVETMLHRSLGRHRVRGEWFHAEPALRLMRERAWLNEVDRTLPSDESEWAGLKIFAAAGEAFSKSRRAERAERAHKAERARR